jgi:chromosome segregation ATPase
MSDQSQSRTTYSQNAGSGASATNPSEKLDELKQTLASDQEKLNTLSKEISSVQADIAALQGGVGEIKLASGGYTQAIKDLQKKLEEVSCFYNNEWQKVKQAIPHPDVVEAKIKETDDRIKNQADIVSTLYKQSEAAKAESAKADQDVNDKQAYYTALKNSQKTASDQITELVNLKDSISKFGDQNQLPKMYFLLIELDGARKNVTLYDPAELEKKLNSALLTLNATISAAREKKAIWDKAKTDSDAAKKVLDDLQKNRRDLILKSLDQAASPTRAVAA